MAHGPDTEQALQIIANYTGTYKINGFRGIEFHNLQLTSLPPIPSSVEWLSIHNITSILPLTGLPNTIKVLDIHNCLHLHIQEFPSKIEYLYIRDSQIDYLPEFPKTLRNLLFVCLHNIETIPDLPPNIEHVSLWSISKLRMLPFIPNTTKCLNCVATNVKELPPLPINLISLNIRFSPVTELPQLPSTLQSLELIEVPISVLPRLPASLLLLDCSEAQSLLFHQGENETLDEYRRRWDAYHDEVERRQRYQTRQGAILEELMCKTWATERIRDWCFDVEEQAEWTLWDKIEACTS